MKTFTEKNTPKYLYFCLLLEVQLALEFRLQKTLPGTLRPFVLGAAHFWGTVRSEVQGSVCLGGISWLSSHTRLAGVCDE